MLLDAARSARTTRRRRSLSEPLAQRAARAASRRRAQDTAGVSTRQRDRRGRRADRARARPAATVSARPPSGGRRHQTSMISFSLLARRPSRSLDVAIGELLNLVAGALLVVVGDLVVAMQRLDLVDRLVADVADRDACPSSAFLWTILTRSWRRSSFSGGMPSRIVWPSMLGVSPRSLVSIALRIAPTVARSKATICKRPRVGRA